MTLWEQIKNMPEPKPTVFPHIIQWLPDGSKWVATNRDTIEIQKLGKTIKTFHNPFLNIFK